MIGDRTSGELDWCKQCVLRTVEEEAKHTFPYFHNRLMHKQRHRTLHKHRARTCAAQNRCPIWIDLCCTTAYTFSRHSFLLVVAQHSCLCTANTFTLWRGVQWRVSFVGTQGSMLRHTTPTHIPIACTRTTIHTWIPYIYYNKCRLARREQAKRCAVCRCIIIN